MIFCIIFNILPKYNYPLDYNTHYIYNFFLFNTTLKLQLNEILNKEINCESTQKNQLESVFFPDFSYIMGGRGWGLPQTDVAFGLPAQKRWRKWRNPALSMNTQASTKQKQ
jgi:hypothetical protein